MTDNQLAILLRQYHARLYGLVKQVERELPEAMAETYQNKLIPSFPPTTTYPVTDGLWALVTEIEQAAQQLERATA